VLNEEMALDQSAKSNIAGDIKYRQDKNKAVF